MPYNVASIASWKQSLLAGSYANYVVRCSRQNPSYCWAKVSVSSMPNKSMPIKGIESDDVATLHLLQFDLLLVSLAVSRQFLCSETLVSFI